MPTYDYQCAACGHAFEKFQSMTARVLRKCPSCGKPKLERLIGTGAGFIFKGDGFYITDYRSDSYKAGEKAAGEQTAVDRTAGDDAKVDKAASDKAASDKPASDKPAGDKSAGDGTAGDAPRKRATAVPKQVEAPPAGRVDGSRTDGSRRSDPAPRTAPRARRGDAGAKDSGARRRRSQ